MYVYHCGREEATWYTSRLGQLTLTRVRSLIYQIIISLKQKCGAVAGSAQLGSCTNTSVFIVLMMLTDVHVQREEN